MLDAPALSSSASPPDTCDIAVIGAGAAGLFAAIFAGRALGSAGTVVALDGAKKLGAKILVAGGGRCNVTHHVVDEHQYAGTSRPAIRNVLGRFSVDRTIAFFAAQGVELKQEDTGKLFPTTDDANTVLDAILAAARDARVSLRHPCRVEGIARASESPDGSAFLITGSDGTTLRARRIVLATGGMALPRTGSDGLGYTFAKQLGHTLTSHIFPALVPLLLPKGHWATQLSGISVQATLRVVLPKAPLPTATGEARSNAIDALKPTASFSSSVLFTHFGLSGPAVLDVSRYWSSTQPQQGAPASAAGILLASWLPLATRAAADEALTKGLKVTIKRWLTEQNLPERIALALLSEAGLPADQTTQGLSRAQRLSLLRALYACELPIAGDRGFTFAEVTAGGVPLNEVRLDTLESRLCPGLHLCGEILDVDGRVGGFNFQWAWASGFVAGTAAAALLTAQSQSPQP